MHWYWIDRFLLFERKKRARAVKLITLGEDYLHQHFPYFPVMPASLIIEGVAQTGGLLICEANGYREKVVLGKLPKFVFHETVAFPGDTLTYTTDVISLTGNGAIVSATVHKNERLMAEGEVVFAHLKGGFAQTTLFAEGNMYEMMQLFGAYEVGVDEEGNPLVDPKFDEICG
ncbi:MAG: beta-hydroxyacyl-ACP dehydratase [Planctomycetaceae bacterium]|jgi:3-hydroxyacyl-[acyl-carrier-protein] dehydratase|nr:beta-hydroxyacyl-ACP dehydratase [Planctomycetaceae bacterium]